MQSQNPNKPSKDILTAVKVVLVSGSLVGAVGIWGMFSSKALKNELLNQASDNGENGSTGNVFNPLPTLAEVVAVQPTQAAVVAQVAQPTQAAAPAMRNIAALPTPTITTVQPSVQTVYVGSAYTGTTSGGGASKPAAKAKKPAAKTRTS
jgi:hypothetical protein